MLHSSPLLSAVDIRLTKFPWWQHYYLWLHCQEIGWWCYLTVLVIDSFSNKRSWIHNCLDFCWEVVQWFIIQTSTVCIQNWWKDSTGRPYLSDLPKEASSSTAVCFSRNSLILLWFISLMHFASLFLAPTKFPPLSHRVHLTFLLPAMNCLNSRMNESDSKVIIISTWIAQLAKHEKCTTLLFFN